MHSNEILTADILDIIFEGKNKLYGAYELRRGYNKRIAIALFGMLVFCTIFLFGKPIAGNNSELQPIPVTNMNFVDYPTDKKDKPKPPPILPKQAKPLAVRTKAYTAPLLTNTNVVDVPEVEALAETKIGTADNIGREDDGTIQPPIEASTTAAFTPVKKTNDYEKEFIKIEKEASFPGGVAGWKKYLERNLNTQVATEDGAASGLYTVTVRFTVDINGIISNIHVVSVPISCPSCGREAVRVITKSPKWEPAIQNGRAVTYEAVQNITFQVIEQ